MYKLIIALAVIIASYTLEAQVVVPQSSPKSSLLQTVGLTDIEIEYHRPSAKERVIFGGVVPFDKVWRTGANENTIINFNTDVIINGGPLKKGKYALYTIPRPDSWDVIFYSTYDNWGNPKEWDETKVVLKVSATPESLCKFVESFTIDINTIKNSKANIELSWEKTLISLKIEVPTNALALKNIETALSGPKATDYFVSARYLYDSDGDLNLALKYMNKAFEIKNDIPYWYTRMKALIQAKLGDKKGAIETAKVSLMGAKIANDSDYVKMNEDNIAEWSKSK